jgi:hypothetical protein
MAMLLRSWSVTFDVFEGSYCLQGCSTSLSFKCSMPLQDFNILFLFSLRLSLSTLLACIFSAISA